MHLRPLVLTLILKSDVFKYPGENEFDPVDDTHFFALRFSKRDDFNIPFSHIMLCSLNSAFFNLMRNSILCL